MECIDISHFSGSRASGGLSGFLWWIANYKLYRRYKIESPASDDYEALKEVITKRFKDKWELNLPDLFILDWWKWQLWILKELLKEDRFQNIFNKVNFVSLWKWVARKTAWKLKWEKEKIFYFDQESLKQNKFKIKSIDLNYDQADRLLVKIRDEAHRFSNNYRKIQMKKRI
jgi:excinuclease UvrABC nuclease subunit